MISKIYTNGTMSNLFQDMDTSKLLFNNCYKINPDKKMVFSSPFISAVECEILLALPKRERPDFLINDIIEYLSENVNSDGLINFYETGNLKFDLDTLSRIYSIFCKVGSFERDRRVLDYFKKNKAGNGGYYTWIERKRNNIDYFVNLNIREFFERAKIEDDSLDKYLIKFSKEFLTSGSRYYRDITFPIILSDIYSKNTKNSKSFNKILDLIINNERAKEIINKYENLKFRKSGFIFPQYFNAGGG